MNTGKSKARKRKRESIMKRLSKRLDILVDVSPYNNAEVAEKLDVHYSLVSYWRNGKAWPGIDLIEPLAKLLGVEVGWFWSEEPAPVWRATRQEAAQ